MFDLKYFALSSTKIHSGTLTPREIKPISKNKIILSHIVDACIISTIMMLFMVTLKSSMQDMLILKNLSKNISYSFIGLTTFVMTYISYFYFSYFFNQGQTVGMYLTKTRISMPSNSFAASMHWSLFSLLNNLTMGLFLSKLIIKFQTKALGSIEAHDYLYIELMSEKNHESFNLLETTDKLNLPEKGNMEHIKIAA